MDGHARVFLVCVTFLGSVDKCAWLVSAIKMFGGFAGVQPRPCKFSERIEC